MNLGLGLYAFRAHAARRGASGFLGVNSEARVALMAPPFLLRARSMRDHICEVHWALSRQHEIRAFWRARSKLAWAWLSTCQAGIPRLFPFELFDWINAAVLAA